MNSFSAQLLITAVQKFEKQCRHLGYNVYMYILPGNLFSVIFLGISANFPLEFRHILNIHVVSLSAQLLKPLHRLW